MKLRYVRLMFAAMLCLLGVFTAFAQPYRQLTPNDFTGPVPQGSGFYVAHTSCNVTMRYNVQKYRNNYQLTFNIQLLLNRDRSWINRQMITNADMMGEVLRHEQGHYQIAYLMQQEMIRALNQYRYTGNYQREANDIFQRIDDKYRQMNTDYDNDTQHMQNRKQQAAWVTYLNNEIAQVSNLAMID
jgi:predicted secreted Zn-dependent protease